MPQDVVDALEAQLGKRGSNGGSSSGNNANKVLLAQNAHLEKKVKLLEGQVSGWGRGVGELSCWGRGVGERLGKGSW